MAKALQLLRNSTLYASYTEALTGLQGKLALAKDGEPILARYTEGGSEHTILGIAGKNAGQYTIFDNAGATAYVDGQIAAIKGENYDDATYKTLAAISAELVKIEGENTVDGSFKKAIKDAIETLDVADTAEAKKLVSGVSETDGKITVSRVGIKSDNNTVVLTQSSATDDIDFKVNVDGQTIIVDTTAGKEGQLKVASAALVQYVGSNAIAVSDVNGENNKTISAVISSDDKFLSINEEGGKEGLMATLNVVKADGQGGRPGQMTGNNIKEAYAIVDKNGNQVGEQIPVYKDSALHSVQLGKVGDKVDANTGVITKYNGTEAGKKDDALVFVYHKEDGTYELVAVNVADFLRESEFKNGLLVNNGEVSVKVDAASEEVTTAEGTQSAVLSVGEDGVKVGNIQAAIDYAVGSKNVDAEGDDYVTASAENNKVTVVSKVVKMASVAGDTKALADAKDVKDYVDAAAAKATTVVKNAVADQSFVTVALAAKQAGETFDTYTVAVNDIASDAELTLVETAVGLAADGTYTPNSSMAYIKEAATIKAALEALDSALKTADDAMLTGVTAGNGIAVGAKAGKEQSISIKLEGARGGVNNALELGENGLYLSEFWDCGEY